MTHNLAIFDLKLNSTTFDLGVCWRMNNKPQKKLQYGIQGPDALAFSVLIFLAGLVLLMIRSGTFLVLATITIVAGLFGITLMVIESSSRYRSSLRDFLMELSGANSGQTVLDVGTGRGLLAIGFAKRGCKTYGIDIWSKADLWNNTPLKTVQNINIERVDVKLQHGDIRAIPFKNKCFDIVISSYVVHNIHSSRQMQTAVKELARISKIGGKLLIADINPFWGPGWSKSRWMQELSAMGFNGVKFHRFWLATIIVTKLRAQ